MHLGKASKTLHKIYSIGAEQTSQTSMITLCLLPYIYEWWKKYSDGLLQQ